MLCHVRCSDVTLFAFVFIGLSLSLAQPLAQQNDLPYKVYRIYPQNWKDVDQIAQIRKMEIEKQLDFWVDSNSPNQFADLMVPPFMIEEIEEFFERHKLRFNVTIPDVQKLIYRNEVDVKAKSNAQIDKKTLNSSSTEIASFLRRFSDNVGFSSDDNRIGHTRADYPFGDYASYKAMMKFMRTIEFYYPKFTKLIRIGMTHEGRPIEGLKIGFPIENTSKRAVWIDGNIHAREWASSHTALFFINQLVAGYGNDREITDYIDNLNFFIIPNLNPDGYEYTRESSRPEIRLWRKNRSPEKCVQSLWGGLRCCQGVDLNRNFAWHWSETGSTENPCSNLYHGSGVFSEPEARAVNDFLTTPQMADKVDAFITLHTYAQLWIHPFSHELGSYTRDYHDLRNLGVKAAKRLESVYGTHYKVGTGADLLSPASGGSDDWAKGTLGIKYVYTLELRPELEVSRGFILHKSELIPTGVETFEAVKEVVKAVLKYNNIDVDRSKQRETQRPLEEAPRPPNFVQGVSNVISQAKSTELEPTPVVNKVVFGNVKNREILIFSKNSQPSVFTEVPVVVSSFSTSTTTTTTSMSTLATTSTTTTTTAATPKPTTPSTTTSTTTTSTASPSTTTTTTTVPATVTTTPSTTALTTTTTTQAPTTTTTVATTTTIEARVLKPYRPVVQNNMATSHERQKLSYGQRLSLQLIRKQMLRLRNQTPTTSSYPRTPLPSSTLPPSTEPPIAMAPLRADMSLEEQATVPKLEPAVVFLAERGPVAQSTMHRSAPRFLTVSLQRPPANREILLLPPLRSDAPMTGINEIVGKPETVFSPKPMSPSVQEFLTGESCKDIRYSCAYWIRNNPRVCVEQDTYMRLQCAATCGYCNQ